ncbi:MAG: hypothetical protein CVT61_01870 [Actinobacteria bacterium HGW-Actinobacteria-11]|nr:MAG: hypothetical protein CVT61_01870 [Actinobacteria bacterium HGW-Actinobacteria-11]
MNTTVDSGLTRHELREQHTEQDTSPAPTPADPAADTKDTSRRRRPRPVTFGHFSAIDGARGVAILSVLLYHSGWSERGLFGVDMFFVVSGFLITILLIKEASSTGRIRIGKFYARRAKRLLPPLFITLAATLVMLWSMGTLAELKAAAETALASLLQIANWQQIAANSGYWESTGQIVPLGQMWSLSATEQFYIVWPLLVAALWFIARRRPGALALWLFVALAAATAVAPVLFDGSNSDRLYLGTDARAVSFVAGAAFAALVAWTIQKAPRWAGIEPSRPARTILTTLSIASLTAVVAASVATSSYHEAWLYQGGLAAVSIAIAFFVATLCFPANALSRVFSWKPLRVVGVIAYSMFLLHLPVFWLLQRMNPDIPPLLLFLVGAVLTWLLATVLHYVFAEPLRMRTWRPLSAAIAIVVTGGLVATGAWFLPIERVNNPRPVADSAAPFTPGQAFAVETPAPLPAGHAGGPLVVAVVGDSVAGNIYESLAEYRTGDLTAIDLTQGGCGIFDADSARSGEGYIMDTVDLCWPWKDRMKEANEQNQPDVYILHNLWDANDQLIDGEWVGPGDPRWADRYRKQVELLIELASSSGHDPLILLANDHPRDPAGPLSAKRLAEKDAIADALAAQYPNVETLDFYGATCPDHGTCLSEDAKGQPLYTDGSHFAPAGLAAMARWLENQIAAALP